MGMKEIPTEPGSPAWEELYALFESSARLHFDNEAKSIMTLPSGEPRIIESGDGLKLIHIDGEDQLRVVHSAHEEIGVATVQPAPAGLVVRMAHGGYWRTDRDHGLVFQYEWVPTVIEDQVTTRQEVLGKVSKRLSKALHRWMKRRAKERKREEGYRKAQEQLGRV